MLALKGALRVAALLSSPSFRSMASDVPGRDGKAGASTEPESRVGLIAAPDSPFKRGHSGVAETGDILALR